jgi:hypothetical protein
MITIFNPFALALFSINALAIPQYQFNTWSSVTSYPTINNYESCGSCSPPASSSSYEMPSSRSAYPSLISPHLSYYQTTYPSNYRQGYVADYSSQINYPSLSYPKSTPFTSYASTNLPNISPLYSMAYNSLYNYPQTSYVVPGSSQYTPSYTTTNHPYWAYPPYYSIPTYPGFDVTNPGTFELWSYAPGICDLDNKPVSSGVRPSCHLWNLTD